MLSKNKLKELQKLQRSKFRKEAQEFVVEGPKMILDLRFEGITPKAVYAISEWISEHEKTFNETDLVEVSASELQKISSLKTANKVLAVYDYMSYNTEWLEHPKNWFLVLDGVQDPGNLGTIIRLCDWFGIDHILCSNSTVDMYNPKVVQATMASIARVGVHYVDLPKTLKRLSSMVSLFVTDMKGDSVYKAELPLVGGLIMGNEGNGVSEELKALIHHRLSIPKMNTDSGVESLNVATATGILLSHIRA